MILNEVEDRLLGTQPHITEFYRSVWDPELGPAAPGHVPIYNTDFPAPPDPRLASGEAPQALAGRGTPSRPLCSVLGKEPLPSSGEAGVSLELQDAVRWILQALGESSGWVPTTNAPSKPCRAGNCRTLASGLFSHRQTPLDENIIGFAPG